MNEIRFRFYFLYLLDMRNHAIQGTLPTHLNPTKEEYFKHLL